MRRFVIVILVVVTLVLSQNANIVYAAPVAPPGLGFGVCHWPAPSGLNFRDTVNWFYWGGGAEDWINIEPQRGVFTLEKLDKQLDTHFKYWPETSFWLDIMNGMPSTVPDWAKEDPSLKYIEFGSRTSTFPIWNAEYQEVFETLLTKVSEHIYAPSFKYRNKIKAVIMMSGGPFGEMIAWSNCPNSEVCKKYLAAGYTDEAYYDALVNWLTPMYVRLFPDYPIVLQLGGGIYGNGVSTRVTNALVDRYGSRMFIKWNGWDRKYAHEPNSTDRYHHKLMASVADRAMVGFEPGWAWAIPDNQTPEMRQSIFDSILKTLDEVPVSYFCLQREYYDILTADQLLELSRKFRGLQMQYPPFGSGPRPTNTPLPTNTPSPTSLPPQPSPSQYNTPTMEPVQPTSAIIMSPTDVPQYNPPEQHPTEIPTPQEQYQRFIPIGESIPKRSNPVNGALTFFSLDKQSPTMLDVSNLVCKDGMWVRGGVSNILQFPRGIIDFLVTTDAQMEQFFMQLTRNYSFPSQQ